MTALWEKNTMDRGPCCQGIGERALRGAKIQSWGLKRPPAGRGCRPKGLTHFPWDDPAVACANNMMVTVQWSAYGPRID